MVWKRKRLQIPGSDYWRSQRHFTATQQFAFKFFNMLKIVRQCEESTATEVRLIANNHEVTANPLGGHRDFETGVLLIVVELLPNLKKCKKGLIAGTALLLNITVIANRP